MDLYTNAKVSPAGKVNKQDLKSWINNLLIFLAQLGVIYVLQLHGALQKGTLVVTDFTPSLATVGAIELYVVNGVLDLLRKFNNSKN